MDVIHSLSNVVVVLQSEGSREMMMELIEEVRARRSQNKIQIKSGDGPRPALFTPEKGLQDSQRSRSALHNNA